MHIWAFYRHCSGETMTILVKPCYGPYRPYELLFYIIVNCWRITLTAPPTALFTCSAMGIVIFIDIFERTIYSNYFWQLGATIRTERDFNRPYIIVIFNNTSIGHATLSFMTYRWHTPFWNMVFLICFLAQIKQEI
jgi:hypothetical protein